MKVVITGGAGFLGYHLCKGFVDKFDEIIVLDIVPIKPDEYPKNVKYFKIDVRNSDAIDKILKNVDLVVHGAAALPLWKCKDIFDINVKGTRNVLEASKNNGVKRVVYVSSTAVYGVPEKHPIYENDELVGVGSYGESKIEAEKVCEEYRKKGMCVPVIRPKTFIGTGRLGVFQILYDWVKNGKKIPIIGNGENHYQLLEVEDLVDAIYLLLTASPAKVNDAYNVGAKEFGRVLDDVGALCEFVGSGARVMTTPARLVKFLLVLFEKLKLSPLYKWVYGTADTDSFVSIEKIEKALGWLPKYSNAEALIRSYKWYLEHCDELQGTGITHRVAWNQGILAMFKKLL
ncbi:NAD(P)-dependent oxidoreductase [candidate division WOR-3 bacterium]|nr:NAD(P)-dependent oxidoreductase [candidate division WOR-3 bacterium]